MIDARNARLLASLLVAGSATSARAQTQIKGRVMVMVDTSGSMVWRFNDDNNCHAVGGNGPGPCGDGDLLSRYTDTNVAMQSYYPGRIVANVPQGTTSRLYGAKAALADVINSTGDLDFGLMRYVVNPLCPNQTNCCNFQGGGVGTNQACVCSHDYIDNAVNNPATQCFGGAGNVGDGRITFAGSCGAKDNNGNVISGGQILVQPTQQNNNTSVLQWIDGVEDFRPGGLNGYPLNPELRASGDTPLAGTVRSMTSWYQTIYNDSKNLNCNPVNDPNCDLQINCRPYVFVVMTDDGTDTCDGCMQATCPIFNNQQVTNPPAAVQTLFNVNPKNPVLTYVIGLALNNNMDPGIAMLNNMAANGGTGQARFAFSQADIQAAFADISAASVKYEICNALDDNCNGLTDEGFDKGAACVVGVGGCQKSGIKKCTLDGSGTQCCVNDGKVDGPCAVLAPGAPGPLICQANTDNNCNGIQDLAEPGCQMGGCKPTPEICNGLDDDCDGVIDDNLLDTNKPCGLAIGQCKPGTTVCVAANGKVFPDPSDHLVCQGGVGPAAEICDGLDNDCDGITDGMTRSCYDGAPKTDNVGICHDGQQKCVLGAWGQCIGEQQPVTELCNGLDGNCDGVVGDVMGAGVSCCPSMKCGVGICANGSTACLGGALQCTGGQGPSPEICDGLDDDCNGVIDDVPNLGKPCVAMNGCVGVIACDVPNKTVVCQPNPNCMMMMGCANDPMVGMPCGNAKMLPLPCKAGKWVCMGGQLVCNGEVTPSMELCNGVDDDCNGMTDDGATCPGDYTCYSGQCDPNCQNSEFPCPGGFSDITVNTQCLCVPDKDCHPACVAPLTCDTKTGKCVDLCAGVSCSVGLACDKRTGECLGCEAFGCPVKCTRCDTSSHSCLPDKCCNVVCAAGQFCDPSDGMCRGTCEPACQPQETCSNNGMCVPNLCYMVTCFEGQACDHTTGNCVTNGCADKTCGPHLGCCGPAASCQADPCEPVRCPASTVCHFDPLTCQTSCDAAAALVKEQVVGAGGGFGCSIERGPGSPRGLAMLLTLFVLIVRRRRGRRLL